MARLDPGHTLGTVWKVPDDLWENFVRPLLLQHDPEPRTGRPRIDPRRALDGIIFILRSGCQWNNLPAEYGSDSSVHRTYQRWVRLGLFERIWAELLNYARSLGLIDWTWQSSDTSSGKARFRGAPVAQTRPIGPNPARNAA